MKSFRSRIAEIKIDKANLQHIASTGEINGSLLIDLEFAMKVYALEACKEQREICVREVMYTYDNIVECSVVDNDSILNAPSPELK